MARAPEVFTLDPAPGDAGREKDRASAPVTVVETTDPFVQEPVSVDEIAATRGSVWSRLFVAAFGAFLSLAVGVWAYDLVAGLLAKWPPLGYLALGLAGLSLVALLVVAARELSALRRLGSAVTLRAATEEAYAAGTDAAARDFVSKISSFYRHDPGTAGARTALEGYTREIIDGSDLLRLAERELLKPKDDQARALIASASSKVAMVTTLSPRAWVDVGFVLFQGVRLISQLATVYSGRPGGFAIWRLSARVLTHLAVTGGVAVAQDAISQFIGAGLAGRLSSKLGEGVLNGVLTARVGLSAIAVCRPMPFRACAAPELSDVAGSLLSLKGSKEKSAL